MKRIGMRTIKTLISIFICLMIFIILKGVCIVCHADKDYAFYWYNPFFAAIATAYSIYPNIKKSIEQAKNRCVASLIGGFVGILLVLAFETILGFINHDFNSHYWPTLTSPISELIIPYVLVAICSIFVVVIGVKLNKQPAIFVSILTFLSITVNANAVIANEIGEIGFGLNRIMSTIIGVLVALLVNSFRIPRRYKNKDLLFAVGIDGVLYNDLDRIKGYMNYKINSLNSEGINTTLFTARTPVNFMYLLDDVEVSHPIVCMSGAAMYDAKNFKYTAIETIPYEYAKELDDYLENINVTPFKAYIIEDVLNLYCESIDNDGERFYMNGKKNAPFCNFHLGKNEEKRDPIYYLVIENDEVAEKILDNINNSNLNQIFYAQVFDVFDKTVMVEGLKYVKIFSKKILELNILKDYCLKNNLRLVGLSSSNLADHLLLNSEISISNYSSNNKIIKVKDFDHMLKKATSIYHDKKYRIES
ncbi:MAG: HAD hydrolase family protein [Anaeroplasma sp.]